MRRWLGAATVLAVAVQTIGLTGLGTSVAKADAWEDLTTLSADALPTWQTNGIAWVTKAVGDVVYVGGTFTKIRPPGVAEGGPGEVTRNNFAAFDAVTGDLLPCAPSLTWPSGTPTVRALEPSPDGSRLYVGGRFSQVTIGSTTTGVASLISLDTATCTLTNGFRRPAINNLVRAISATSDAVYFGGDFSTVDSQARTRLAKVTSAGTLTSFNANINNSVWALIAAPDHGKVIVGGQFTAVNGVSGANARSLIALHPDTGATVHNFASWSIPNNSVNHVLVRDGDRFYIGNEGTGGGVFDGRAAGLLSTGAMLWKDNCLGATQALAVYEGVLYSGHHAHDCKSTPGGFPDGKRNHFLAQSTDDMTILPWFPNSDGGLGEALGPRSMTIGGGQLWVAGEFTQINGVPQQGITRFGPVDTGFVDPPLLHATSNLAGKITISWTAGWDRDDDKITYELFRTGTSTPIFVQTVRSREWSRPRMVFTDEVGPGVTASYSIRTSDGENVSPKGPPVTATAATSDKPYVGTVSTDGPRIWWRMDETSGTTAADSSGAGHTGVYDRVTLGVAPALASGDGKAGRFNGSNSRLNTQSTVKIAYVTDFSVEVWFKTTSTRGGRLMGYGNNRTGTSSSHDRTIYMSNSGNVLFGVYTNTTNVIKSPGTYRDGQWHHVVGTKGPMGMRLYIDGKLIGSNSVSGQQPYYGFWNLGGDNLSGWPDRPSTGFFNGDLDEGTIYDKPLPPARVFDHFKQGKPTGWSDTASPSTPGRPTLSAVSSKVSATWTASTDDMLVAGYRVYRSQEPNFTPGVDTLVGTTDWPEFTEKGVNPGTWYYKVVAFDGMGKSSAASQERSITVSDTEAPTKPAGLETTAFGDEVDLTWKPSTDDMAVTGYDVFRLSSPTGTMDASTLVGTTLGTSYTDTSVPPGTWYYRVVAKDAAGNRSAPSAAADAVATEVGDPIDFDAIDALAPAPEFSSAPPPSTGTPSTIPGATLIPWNDSRLTLRGATGFTTGTAYPDTLFVQPNSRYPGNRGSQPVFSVDFDTDASVFEVYTKYLNATSQAIQVKVNGHRTTVTPRPVGGTTLGSRLLYKVDFGSSANRHITLETSYFPFGGILVPSGATVTKSAPTSGKFVVVGDSITGGSNENAGAGAGTWLSRTADYLGWTDWWNQAIGGTGYLASNGSLVSIPNRIQADAVAHTPQRLLLWAGYNDQLLNQSSLATAAGNTLSAIKSGTPGSRVYVVGPFSPKGNPDGSLRNTDATLRTAAKNAGFAFISPYSGKVYDKNGDLIASQRPWITGTGSTVNPQGDGNADLYIGNDGIHPNDAGHRYLAQRMATALKAIVDGEAPFDTQAPSTPGSVTGTVEGTSVKLSWTASTDNVEVAGYDVHRGTTAGFTPAAGNRIAQVTGTSYTDAAGIGTWYYKVVAKDHSGNTSSPGASGAVQVVAPDVTPPSTPTNVAASRTNSDVTVSWTASTDDRGVVGYDVHRGSSAGFTPSASNRVAQVTGTSTTETSVPGGTWYYKVVARDAAGNHSAASSAASITVVPPEGQTITLSPIADTYVNLGARTTNYGGSSSLIVDGDPSQYSLLRFNLPEAPYGLRLTGATLKLRSTSADAATSVDTVSVTFAEDTWTESTVTWNTGRPALESVTLGSFPPISAVSTFYTASLDPELLSTKTGSTTLALTMAGGDSALFYSKEYGSISSRPTLELQYN